MTDLDDYGVLAHSFEKNSTTLICFHLQEYKGHQFISIREFYRDKSSGDWRPTKSGVTISPDYYAELLQGVVGLGEALGFSADTI